MTDLNVHFLGLNFPNPFLLASGPPTANGKMVIDGFKHGWGGAILKTIGLEPTRHPCPRLQVIRTGREKTGMVNLELISDLKLSEWLNQIDEIKNQFPDRPLIASIMGGGNSFEWQEVEYQLEKHGIDGFEMNVSCPNFVEQKGAQLGQDPESLSQAVRWVREATKLPVIVKLTPNVTDILVLAKVAKDSGADAVTATNTLSGLAGIDLSNFTPLPVVQNVGMTGGYGGPGLKPVALRCAANISKSIDIPVIGCGGITNWKDAVEYIAVGASMVEVCTAVMWNGFEIINSLINGLLNYLEDQGFSHIHEIRGKALSNLVQFSGLNLQNRLIAKVENEKCNGCGICKRACWSGGYQAIDLINKKAIIDQARCDGCGLCLGLCPLNAISMDLKIQ